MIMAHVLKDAAERVRTDHAYYQQCTGAAVEDGLCAVHLRRLDSASRRRERSAVQRGLRSRAGAVGVMIARLREPRA